MSKDSKLYFLLNIVSSKGSPHSGQNLGSLNDLTDGINQLNDAMSQLLDGASQLEMVPPS